MGRMLGQTKAMGPYSVELRQESFYLTRAGVPGDGSGRAGGQIEDGQALFPRAEVSRLLCALGVTARWAPLGIVASPSMWVVEDRGAVLAVSGPWRVYVDEHEDAVNLSVEVLLADLLSLSTALAAVEAPVTPGS